MSYVDMFTYVIIDVVIALMVTRELIK